VSEGGGAFNFGEPTVKFGVVGVLYRVFFKFRLAFVIRLSRIRSEHGISEFFWIACAGVTSPRFNVWNLPTPTQLSDCLSQRMGGGGKEHRSDCIFTRCYFSEL
jgi:hypothetical protein